MGYLIWHIWIQDGRNLFSFTGKSCLLSYRGLEVLDPIYKLTASRCSFCNYVVSARCYIASIKSCRKHCLFHSFSHNHTRTLFYSSSTSVPLLLSHLHSIHTPSTFPTRTLTIFTTQFNSILSLHRHTQHRTSSLPLPFHTNLQFPTSTALESQYPW